MFVHLTEILDGLFQMLQNHIVEIHLMKHISIFEKYDPAVVDMSKMSNMMHVGHAQLSNEFIQVCAAHCTIISKFICIKI